MLLPVSWDSLFRGETKNHISKSILKENIMFQIIEKDQPSKGTFWNHVSKEMLQG